MKNRIRELRKERGLTQQALAAKIGCHYRQIQKLESGEYDFENTSVGMALKIAASLDVDIYGLMEKGENDLPGLHPEDE